MMRNELRNLLAAAVFGMAAALLITAIALPVYAQSAAGNVGIDNFTFNPQRLTVKAGTTVRWTNKDDIPHAVAAAGKLFKSKALDTDDSYAFTFTTPGNYEYFCSLHPHMTGTVVVISEAGNDAGR